MKGFLLTLLALVLFMILAPFGVLWQIINSIGAINKYFFTIAIAIDQSGNVVCAQLLTDVMVKKNGISFGNPDSTISSIIGKNKENNTLTIAGKTLYFILNSLEKNHSENAIEKDENDSNVP